MERASHSSSHSSSDSIIRPAMPNVEGGVDEHSTVSALNALQTIDNPLSGDRGTAVNNPQPLDPESPLPDPTGSITLIVRAPGNDDVDSSIDEAHRFRQDGQTIEKAAIAASQAVAKEFLESTYGVGEADFKKFVTDTKSCFSPSASAGQTLDRLNDHAGILIVPVKTKGLTIAERLTVISQIDKVTKEERYFVQGYGNRIVRFDHFEAAVKAAQADEEFSADADSKTKMETPFRTQLLNLSKSSELQARRSHTESDQVAFPTPLNPSALPTGAESWSNFDDNLPPGFGRTHAWDSANDKVKVTPLPPSATKESSEAVIELEPHSPRDDVSETTDAQSEVSEPKDSSSNSSRSSGEEPANVSGILPPLRDDESKSSDSSNKSLQSPKSLLDLDAIQETPPKSSVILDLDPAVIDTSAPQSPRRQLRLEWHERELYVDRNKIENRLLIFFNQNYDSGKVRPPPAHGSNRASVKIGGPMLAQLDGVVDIEIMSPVAQVVGVKASFLKIIESMFTEKKSQGVTLRITTQDKAIHELRLTDKGAKLTLIAPTPAWGKHRSGAAFGVGTTVVADVDLYSYCGVDVGAHGSASGFADPVLITTCGDRILTAPFLHVASGFRGTVEAAASSAANIITLQPMRNADRTSLGWALQKTLQMGLTFGYVDVMTLGLANFRGVNNTLLGGSHAFSASSGQVMSAQLQAGIAAMTVGSQECLTKIFGWVENAIPERFKVIESKFKRAIWHGAVPSLGEYVRLLTNCGVQKLLGVDRGSGGDVLAQFVQGVGVGIGKGFGSTTGSPQNHRALQIIGTASALVWDTAARAGGNVAHVWSASGVSFAELYKEAIVTRIGTRGLDKLLSGVVADLLDATGLVGPHAGAYSHQLSREARITNFVADLQSVADELVKRSASVDDKAWEMVEASYILRKIANGYQAVKPTLNSWMLGTITYSQKHNRDRAEADEVVDAIARKQIPGLLTDLKAKFSKMIKRRLLVSEAQEEENEDEGNSRKANDAKSDDWVISIEDLPVSSRERTKVLLDSHKDSVEPHPVKVNYDGRVYPSNAEPRHAKSVRRSLTTFSETAQAHAKGAHDAMSRDPGMATIRNSKLPAVVIFKIEQAVKDYTVESQMFHYPLRWPRTGQRQIVPIASGVSFEYNVLHSSSGKAFDPIGVMYLNLGALHAEKFPCISYRAVVTDAAYRPKVETITAPADRRATALPAVSVVDLVKPADPGYTIVEKDHVMMTEILSSSLSKKLVASFGNSLGFGTAGKERLQMIALIQESGVNVTRYTDLVQAEVISMPGAVFKVESIDEKAEYPVECDNENKNENKDKNQAFAQIVFLRTVDTYALELMHGTATDEDDIEIDPETGHWLMVKPQPDGTLKKVLATPKNYAMGWDMERPDKDEPTKFSTKRARWLYPYTSDYSPRAIKDAIHAALLTEEPIVPFLDQAIKNVHHEYFRKQGGFDYEAEGERVEAIKDKAKNAIASLNRRTLTLDRILRPEDSRLMAWLITSMLHRPITLVELDHGFDHKTQEVPKNPKMESFHSTYLGGDISVKIDGSPAPAVLIGIKARSVYAIQYRDGKSRAIPIGNGDLSTENFLHAYVHAVQESKFDDPYAYDEKKDCIINADSFHSVVGFYDALMRFATKDFIVLQEGIVDFIEGKPSAKAPTDKSISDEADTQLHAEAVEHTRRLRQGLASAWIDKVAEAPMEKPGDKDLSARLNKSQRDAVQLALDYAATHPTVSLSNVLNSWQPEAAEKRHTLFTALRAITREDCQKTFGDLAEHMWTAISKMRGEVSQTAARSRDLNFDLAQRNAAADLWQQAIPLDLLLRPATLNITLSDEEKDAVGRALDLARNMPDQPMGVVAQVWRQSEGAIAPYLDSALAKCTLEACEATFAANEAVQQHSILQALKGLPDQDPGVASSAVRQRARPLTQARRDKLLTFWDERVELLRPDNVPGELSSTLNDNERAAIKGVLGVLGVSATVQQTGAEAARVWRESNPLAAGDLASALAKCTFAACKHSCEGTQYDADELFAVLQSMQADSGQSNRNESVQRRQVANPRTTAARPVVSSTAKPRVWEQQDRSTKAGSGQISRPPRTTGARPVVSPTAKPQRSGMSMAQYQRVWEQQVMVDKNDLPFQHLNLSLSEMQQRAILAVFRLASDRQLQWQDAAAEWRKQGRDKAAALDDALVACTEEACSQTFREQARQFFTALNEMRV